MSATDWVGLFALALGFFNLGMNIALETRSRRRRHQTRGTGQ